MLTGHRIFSTKQVILFLMTVITVKLILVKTPVKNKHSRNGKYFLHSNQLYEGDSVIPK